MYFLCYFYNFFLTLRYKITIRGLENLDKNKNYLILPNHPALVDPQILVSIFGKQILVSPLISETYFNIPVVKYLFKSLKAVSVPDLQRGNNSGKEQIEETIGIVKNSLKNGGNILIYPAGQLYNQNKEIIKGKKMSFEITRDLGENTEILLVKTSGLWGSMRSKAYDGKTPNFFKTFLKSIFYIFANLIFFSPRRKVNIEVVNFTEILKNINNVNEFNEILENFYNKKEEELIYKKHFFYFDDLKGKTLPEELLNLNKTENNLGKEELLKEIPEINKIKIFKQIAKIKEISEEKIRAENNLISDLYFDSLDLSEIKVFIQSEFKNADNPEILSLKFVSDLILMSDGKSFINESNICAINEFPAQNNFDLKLNGEKYFGTKIISAAYYLPEKIVSSLEIENKINFNHQYSKGFLENISGIKFRRISTENEYPSLLAYKACENLFSKLEKKDYENIDLIIFSAASSDLFEPATGNLVWELLKKNGYINKYIPAFDIKNACNSFISAIDIADSFIKTGKYKKILICSGEEGSKSTNFNPKNIEEFKQSFSGYTLGDAGSAMILEASNESKILHSEFLSNGNLWDSSTILGGANRFKNAKNKDFFMGNSNKLYEFFKEVGNDILIKGLKKVGWNISEIKKVFIHQISKQMVDNFLKTSGFSKDKIRITYENLGNIASCTIPLNLAMEIENGNIKRGDKIIFIGFAAGASFGVIFLEY